MRMLYRFLSAVPTLLCFMHVCVTASFALAENRILVFAAASTNAPLSHAAKVFEEQSHHKVIISYAGSAALAQQISLGAPANIYISANIRWMDYLDDKKVLAAEGPVSFLSNSLILVRSKKRIGSDQESLANLPNMLANGRLAVGDPDHVPAGIYAKEALKNLNIWGEVRTSLARQPSVSSALALVESNEVPYAIVYASDAHNNPNIQEVARFPENAHTQILYQLALIKGHLSTDATKFKNFLLSRQGRAIFEEYGFLIPKIH